MFKYGGGRKFLAMALIAVAWFARDQFSTWMDKDALQAQQVLTEKSAHDQRQQQNLAQREMFRQLSRIEINQQKSNQAVVVLGKTLTQEVDDDKDLDGGARTATDAAAQEERRMQKETEAYAAELLSKDFKLEGQALAEDVKDYERLVRLVSGGGTYDAAPAKDVAKKLSEFSFEPDPTVADIKAIELLEKQWFEADEQLRKAWAELDVKAQEDETSSAESADAARFFAWIFTAIGGVIAGDWRKILAGLPGMATDTTTE